MSHLSDFADYDDYLDFQREANADRIEDARRDAADDWLDRNGWVCENGHRWNPIRHRATRTDPAYVEIEECPECGGEPI